MISRETKTERTILVRINPGDDILMGIREAVAQHEILNGIILAGIGSVRKSHFHVVMSNELPPSEGNPKSEQPLDVCSMQGFIAEGRVHAHVTFSDERNAFGGHLEEGCIALTFAIIAIGTLGDVDIEQWDSIRDENEMSSEPK